MYKFNMRRRRLDCIIRKVNRLEDENQKLQIPLLEYKVLITTCLKEQSKLLLDYSKKNAAIQENSLEIIPDLIQEYKDTKNVLIENNINLKEELSRLIIDRQISNHDNDIPNAHHVINLTEATQNIIGETGIPDEQTLVKKIDELIYKVKEIKNENENLKKDFREYKISMNPQLQRSINLLIQAIRYNTDLIIWLNKKYALTEMGQEIGFNMTEIGSLLIKNILLKQEIAHVRSVRLELDSENLLTDESPIIKELTDLFLEVNYWDKQGKMKTEISNLKTEEEMDENSNGINEIEDEPFEVQNIWLDLSQEIARQKIEYNNPLLQENQSENYFYYTDSDYTHEVVIPMDMQDETQTSNLGIIEEANLQEIQENKNLIFDQENENTCIIPEALETPNMLFVKPETSSTTEEKQFVKTRIKRIGAGKRRNTQISCEGEIKPSNMNSTEKENPPIKEEPNMTAKIQNRRRGSKLSENTGNSQIAFEEKENPLATEKKKKTVKTRYKRKGIKLPEKPKNHHIVFQGNVTYTCEKCQITFQTKSLLTHHIKTTHSRDNKFSCKFCAMQTTTGYNYRRHLIRFHSLEDDPEVQDLIKAFFESKRNKVFPTARTFAGFPCDKCTKQFSSENTRKLHMQRLHSEDRRTVNVDTVRRKTKKKGRTPKKM